MVLDRVEIVRYKDRPVNIIGCIESDDFHIDEDSLGNLHIMRKNIKTGNWKLPETIICK